MVTEAARLIELNHCLGAGISQETLSLPRRMELTEHSSAEAPLAHYMVPSSWVTTGDWVCVYQWPKLCVCIYVWLCFVYRKNRMIARINIKQLASDWKHTIIHSLLNVIPTLEDQPFSLTISKVEQYLSYHMLIRIQSNLVLKTIGVFSWKQIVKTRTILRLTCISLENYSKSIRLFWLGLKIIS